MKANNSLRINMPRALELISFFFLGHGPTYQGPPERGETVLWNKPFAPTDLAY